jgi:hypothetical protein
MSAPATPVVVSSAGPAVQRQEAAPAPEDEETAPTPEDEETAAQGSFVQRDDEGMEDDGNSA